MSFHFNYFILVVLIPKLWANLFRKISTATYPESFNTIEPSIESRKYTPREPVSLIFIEVIYFRSITSKF